MHRRGLPTTKRTTSVEEHHEEVKPPVVEAFTRGYCIDYQNRHGFASAATESPGAQCEGALPTVKSAIELNKMELEEVCSYLKGKRYTDALLTTSGDKQRSTN